MRYQPAAGVYHLDDRIVRQAGVNEIVTHNAANVVACAVRGVAKGDALIAIYQQIALDDGAGGGGPKEDGGRGDVAGRANAIPLVVAHRPIVGVVGADAVGVIFGGGDSVFQAGAGQQAIVAAVADGVDFDQLVAGIQDVQVVEDRAIIAVHGDAVFVAVAQGEVGDGHVVGEDGDDVGVRPGEHPAAIEDDVSAVAGYAANGKVVDGDVHGILQIVGSGSDEDGCAGSGVLGLVAQVGFVVDGDGGAGWRGQGGAGCGGDGVGSVRG